MSENTSITSYFKIPHFKLLALISAASLVSWLGWGLVITKLDPYESTDLALSLFFISTFLALSGTYCIVLFMMKRWKQDDKVYLKHVSISMRQGILLSFCTVLCLALLMLGQLRIWNGILIVTIITLLEFYFSSKDDL